jgi:hypothetical protein
MVKYLIHCTYQDAISSILRDKILKTSSSMMTSGMGESDVVYFSLYNPKTWKDSVKEELDFNNERGIITKSICLLFYIKDIVRKYKYFFISPYCNYGLWADKISASLHKLVQKSNSINELEINILLDKKMSEQCKYSLTNPERLKMLWRFKNTKNLSIREFIDQNPIYEWYEICFFDNIDFHDIPYQIINKTPKKVD